MVKVQTLTAMLLPSASLIRVLSVALYLVLGSSVVAGLRMAMWLLQL